MIIILKIYKIQISSYLYISISSNNLLSISLDKALSNPCFIKSCFYSSVKSLSMATINYFGT